MAKHNFFYHVSENVRQQREAQGLTQMQLARLAKVPGGAVRQVELKDRDVRLHHLVKIAGALGINLATEAGKIFGEPPRKAKKR
jgi:transcriptional regulator with XRE-family HTH domain